MEFPFNINVDLPADVVLVDNFHQKFLNMRKGIDLLSGRTIDIAPKTDPQEWKLFHDRLAMIINIMGQRSAKAQGLKEPITSAPKLTHSDHRLYILKDAAAYRGRGAVVGIIKVGAKKLFLANDSGNQVEVNPVCLLDFYIDNRKQRQGYGFNLFKIMLQMERITPLQLAIDKPSVFLLRFLQKYYKMDNPQHHHNNYVVFPGFFKSVRARAPTQKQGQAKSRPTTQKQEQAKSGQGVGSSKNDKQKSSSSIREIRGPYGPPSSPDTDKSFLGLKVPTRFDHERKWQEMYDSTWHVFGVPPQDYSYVKYARHPPAQSDKGANAKQPAPAFPKPKYSLL